MFLFACSAKAQAELSLNSEDLYKEPDESALSQLPAFTETNGYVNTPRQINIDLSDKLNYNDVFKTGGTDGISISVTDRSIEYCVVVNREKKLGFPRRVFLKMNLDDKESATMTFDYGNIQKVVLFPELIGGSMRVFGDDASGSPAIYVYIGKAYSDEGWMQEHRAAYEARRDSLSSYETSQSFSEKYIVL